MLRVNSLRGHTERSDEKSYATNTHKAGTSNSTLPKTNSRHTIGFLFSVNSNGKNRNSKANGETRK